MILTDSLNWRKLWEWTHHMEMTRRRVRRMKRTTYHRRISDAPIEKYSTNVFIEKWCDIMAQVTLSLCVIVPYQHFSYFSYNINIQQQFLYVWDKLNLEHLSVQTFPSTWRWREMVFVSITHILWQLNYHSHKISLVKVLAYSFPKKNVWPWINERRKGLQWERKITFTWAKRR